MKICVGASAGGHINELFGLLNSTNGEKIKVDIFVTTEKIHKNSLASKYKSVFIIGECNRNSYMKIPLVLIKAFWAVLSNKPDVVITTGSFPLAIYSRIARVFGAKIIWIDSIANIDYLTASGTWALKFADRVYTQWPELITQYNNDKLFYAGHLI